MQTRRSSPRPPWERHRAYPQHPTGRARRRWPRAYDGGHAAGPQVSPRYRRAFDGDAQATDRRRSPRSMNRLRRSPVGNGLLGLAIAGAAAPIAINSYQEALRTDPSHEAYALPQTAYDMIDDQAVMQEWMAMAEAEAVTADRSTVIDEKLDRFSDFRLTRELAETIYDAAVEADIDPEIAFGLVRAESSFRNQATSPVGAVGLTQLMPRTAAWMEPGIRTQDLRNPETNLRVGFKYLNYLLDKYKGNEDLALLAYNRGPGTVDRALRNGANPDNGYASFVRGEANHGHRLFTNR
jgi:soluble lytic murein transglycosylase-like protein